MQLSWLDTVEPNATLNAAELSRMLGLPLSTLWSRVKAGTFPKPDLRAPRVGRVARASWRVITIRTFLKRIKNETNCFNG